MLSESGKNSRPTKIVYDAVMFAATHHSIVPRRLEILKKKEELRGALIEMYKSDKSGNVVFSGRRTNFMDAQERNRLVLAAFSSVIA